MLNSMTDSDLDAIEARAKPAMVLVLGEPLPVIRSKLLIGTDVGVAEVAVVDHANGDVLRLVAEVRRLRSDLARFRAGQEIALVSPIGGGRFKIKHRIGADFRLVGLGDDLEG